MSRFRLPALAALPLAALSACGSSSSTVTTPSTTAGATTTSTAPAPTRTAYPVKVADCGGRVTTYTKAPTRVVTFDHSVAETLLSLGLGDRIVGLTAFEKPADRLSVTAAEMAKLHQINDGRGYPSKVTTDAGFDYATAEQMKNHLAADSRTSGLTAVLKKSYVVVSFSEVTPTPRVIDGLAKFVDGLIALQGG